MARVNNTTIFWIESLLCCALEPGFGLRTILECTNESFNVHSSPRTLRHYVDHQAEKSCFVRYLARYKGWMFGKPDKNTIVE